MSRIDDSCLVRLDNFAELILNHPAPTRLANELHPNVVEVLRKELTGLMEELFQSDFSNLDKDDMPKLQFPGARKDISFYDGLTDTIHIPQDMSLPVVNLARMVAHETEHARQFCPELYTSEENKMIALGLALYPEQKRNQDTPKTLYLYNYIELRARTAEFHALLNMYYTRQDSQDAPMTPREKQEYQKVLSAVRDSARMQLSPIRLELAIAQMLMKMHTQQFDADEAEMTQQEAIRFFASTGKSMMHDAFNEFRQVYKELDSLVKQLQHTPQHTVVTECEVPTECASTKRAEIITQCAEQSIAMIYPNEISALPTQGMRIYGDDNMQKFLRTNTKSNLCVVIPKHPVGPTPIYFVFEQKECSVDTNHNDNAIVNAREIEQEDRDEEEIIE